MIKANVILTIVIILQISSTQSSISKEECASKKDASSDYNEMITVNGSPTIGDDLHLVDQVLVLNISNSNFRLDVANVKFNQMTQLIASQNYKFNISAIGEESFPNLSSLILSRNAITDIKPDIFKFMKYLVELDLSYNCLETFNFKFLFESLENELSVLNLKGNLIKQLGNQPQIEDVLFISTFDLSYNQLEEFQFINIHVNHLNLQFNKIKKIRLSIDHRYKADSKFGVDASNNSLETFESNILYRYIILLNNQVTSLKSLSWAGADKINLTNNKISSIRDEDFEAYSGFDKLTTPQGFKKFRDCMELDLSQNQLTYINYHNFPQILPNLVKLVLKHNKFSQDFLKQLISYSKSDECDIEIIVDVENLEKINHIKLWIISVGLSVIASIIVMIILFKRKKISYSKYFIVFKDNEVLTNEDQ